MQRIRIYPNAGQPFARWATPIAKLGKDHRAVLDRLLAEFKSSREPKPLRLDANRFLLESEGGGKLGSYYQYVIPLPPPKLPRARPRDIRVEDMAPRSRGRASSQKSQRKA